MHRAVDSTDLGIIWPDLASVEPSANGKPKTETKKLEFFDIDIANNPQQMRAVESVAFRQNKHAPFLLFGSFGAGKTKTLVLTICLLPFLQCRQVEMVKQIIKNQSDARVLICAKVNSAADIFVEKLALRFTTKQMFRLIAFHRALR